MSEQQGAGRIEVIVTYTLPPIRPGREPAPRLSPRWCPHAADHPLMESCGSCSYQVARQGDTE